MTWAKDDSMRLSRYRLRCLNMPSSCHWCCCKKTLSDASFIQKNLKFTVLVSYIKVFFRSMSTQTSFKSMQVRKIDLDKKIVGKMFRKTKALIPILIYPSPEWHVYKSIFLIKYIHTHIRLRMNGTYLKQ